MALTQPPLSMIQATGTAGSTLTVGTNNEVATTATSVVSPYPIDGGFNDANGILTLLLSDGSTVEITGMPTTGSMGVGSTGTQGTNGTDGIRGTDGVNGLPGSSGGCGPQGMDGPPGSSGIDGPAGPTGPTGPAGQPGPPGPMGPQGIQGLDGPQGPVGPTGPEGITGQAGLSGPPGPVGPPGINGSDGQSGNDGPPGPPGPVGLQGPMGITGIPTGGLSGQLLKKTDVDDYDTQWSTLLVPEFLPSTAMVFFQSLPPTGWEQKTFADPNGLGFMLRVVGGLGGNTGGSMSPILMDKVIDHTHNASAVVHDPGHTHTYTTEQQALPQTGHSTWCWYLNTNVQTGTSQTGITFSFDVGDVVEQTSSWTPRYVDCIVAYKTSDSYNLEIETQTLSLFDTGTTTIYFQPCAPYTWTRNDSYSDNMIRIVNGNGGGSGGSMSPILMDVVVAHTHAVSSSIHDPGHSHSYGFCIYTEPQTGHSTPCWWNFRSAQTSTSLTGVTIDVTVDFVDSVNGVPAGASYWTPQYADAIICTKD